MTTRREVSLVGRIDKIGDLVCFFVSQAVCCAATSDTIQGC